MKIHTYEDIRKYLEAELIGKKVKRAVVPCGDIEEALNKVELPAKLVCRQSASSLRDCDLLCSYNNNLYFLTEIHFEINNNEEFAKFEMYDRPFSWFDDVPIGEKATPTDRDILTQNLAQRLFNYVDPWDRDYQSAADIADDIKADPLTVIEYLMDLLENA